MATTIEPRMIPDEAKQRLRILFMAKHALWGGGMHPEDGNHALILRYGLIWLDKAMKRLGHRFGIRASAVVLADGAHAIDVDNARTYKIAAELLDRRAA